MKAKQLHNKQHWSLWGWITGTDDAARREMAENQANRNANANQNALEADTTLSLYQMQLESERQTQQMYITIALIAAVVAIIYFL
ncbi:MAG: hypothetical protein J6V54_10740 [Bacteroidales bacterium]|nr:hypothetical protein [Bacteroidales bacterium]